MGATYTRQSSYADGDIISAADTNDEFNQLLAAFASSTGHTHDGTDAEGGPITKLLGNTLTFGAGTAGTDITITFDGETSDGELKWMEDEDYFEFSDDILIASTEKLQFRDTAIYINSSTDGQLDLVADSEIQIAATTIDINGNVDISGTLTIGGADISETELEILDGATVTTTEINILDGDTTASSTTVVDADRVVFNDAGTMKQVAVTDLAAYFDDEITAMPNLVTTAATTVGALDSGSITSGFGTIDTGSSTITTTGLITGGSLDIDDVLINGTTIGHTDDTDLITLANGVVTVAGEISVTTLDIGGTNITSTPAELNILDGDTTASSTTVADADRVVFNDAGTMKQVAVTDLAAYFDDEITAMPNLVTTAATTVGALDSGSITSGFGTIDTGSSTITTTGLITGGSLDIDDVLINGSTIGHTDDTDLMTLSNGVLTVAGEVDAVSLDVSGDADIDGTLEADAITVNGTALNTVIAGVTVTDATNSAHVLVTDNESTNEENLITFVEDATSSTGNVGLEMDGNLTYNPSTGTVTATVFKGNIDAVDGDFDGTLEADAITLDGTAVTATATLDTGISNNNVPKFTSGVVDNDFLRVDGTAIEGRSASEVLSDIAAAPAAGSSNIVTTGAINSGSITSGFGSINNGSSAITTTGTMTFGSLSDGSITVTAFVDEDNMASDSATLIPTQQSVKAYVDSEITSAGGFTSFFIEDDDGTEVTIDNAKEIKFIGSGITTNFTDTSTGSDGDPFDLTFTVDAAQTGITSILATDLKIGEDDQTKIDFETADEIHFYAANAEQVFVSDGVFGPQTDSDVDLGTTGARFKDAYVDSVTSTGNVVAGGTIEPGGDTSSGDNAAIGYTSAEGLILTGQGSTSDITFKNDADTTVFSIPTGTDDILFPDNAKAMFGASSDLQVSHNGSESIIEDLGTGNLKIKSNGSGINFQKGDSELLATMATDGAVTLYHDNSAKIATSSTGATITGKLDVGSVGTSGGTAGEIAFGGVSGSIDGFRIHNTDGNYLEFRPSSTDAPMVLNNVGNVGIGIDSPTLDSSLSGVTVSGDSTLLHIHDGDGAILKLTDPASGANRGGQIALINTHMLVNNCESDAISFGTGNTERMRLSTGALRIGQSSTDVPGSGNTTTGIGLRTNGDSFFSDADSDAIYGNRNNAGGVVSIALSGTAKGGISVASDGVTFNTTSDRRLKENIEPLEATDKLMEMNPVSFNWKANPDGPKNMGFIAQDMQNIMPEAVSSDDTEEKMLRMDYGRITPILVSALQDAHKKIEELESRIAAMESK